ncbi:MAG: MetQ/NlpA family ABC transporter substrate-binding protein [Catenisphaera adipataccumulans]|jgi:D-methionine transport system substrate-binding protein|uniref:MetQ/NlpA family ABC transporter substrate-binding protein n=1 Tax=Catenisphaera adipataccumulans TaxID=700500 RepID=UPI003D93175A
MKRTRILKAALSALVAVSLAVPATVDAKETKTLTIGATTSPHAIILKHVKKEYEAKGYKLVIKEFSDYPEIDPSTSDGSLDANYFQHQPYLTAYNKDEGLKKGDDGYLVSAGKIHFEPMGIYAGKSDDLKNISDGAQIAIPNDASNEARALLLLQDEGLITLDKKVKVTSTSVTLKQVKKNPHDLDLVEMDGAQIASKLNDVDYGVVNGNYALDADVTDKLLASESTDGEVAQTYGNVIAVQEKDKDSQAVKDLVKILKSEKTQKWIKKHFKGAVLPVEE